MRVLTWNVWGLRGGPVRVVRALREVRADVVCLQECPRWPGGRLVLRLAARAAGLRLASGGGRSGLAVLLRAGRSAPEAGRAGVVRFPRERRGWWWSYPRGATWVRVRHDGVTLVVASAHLDVAPHARTAQAHALAAAFAGAPRLVLAGDLNEPPGGPAWTALGGGLLDADPAGAPTFPVGAGRHARHRLDAVLVRGMQVAGSGPAGAAGHGAGARPVSDHRAVLLEVRPR
ncbi:hypothetical protein FH969_00405 [Miniimonas arenae]|uniref:Endonuclease/exonuclease/phosphatase domain-containing protein n=1 Tax=Miniimonas arenae TaxID=676201 RepID=A0A5C5BG54_9MICO|nr:MULTISPECIES: endonuclease/exonuclease/phosphatase family protein [Miniimonas]TNU77270.1 hypothetical protein FH969_00405 [Miniimonas arenae]